MSGRQENLYEEKRAQITGESLHFCTVSTLHKRANNTGKSRHKSLGPGILVSHHKFGVVPKQRKWTPKTAMGVVLQPACVDIVESQWMGMPSVDILWETARKDQGSTRMVLCDRLRQPATDLDNCLFSRERRSRHVETLDQYGSGKRGFLEALVPTTQDICSHDQSWGNEAQEGVPRGLIGLVE
jgi:hypothetical protein